MKTIIENGYKNKLIEDLYNVDQGDFKALKNAAKDFLDKVYTLSDLYEKGLEQNKIKKKLQLIYLAMRQETSYTRNFLAYAHDFEKAVNNFLGRKIYLTYIKDDGTFIFYDEANIGKLYQEATANKGRGNISKKKIFDANDLEEDLKKAIEKSIKQRYQVYQTAAKRWSDNNTENKKKYNPSQKTFYWKIYNNHKITGWTKPIATLGIIAEGYAGAVINEDPYVHNYNIENSLAVLWNAHIQKDSIGGLVKGDIVLGKNGNIQFAIKEGSFSTAMIGQYVRLAENIKILRDISKEQFQEYLPKLVRQGKITSAIIKALNEEVEKKLENVIKNI